MSNARTSSTSASEGPTRADHSVARRLGAAGLAAATAGLCLIAPSPAWGVADGSGTATAWGYATSGALKPPADLSGLTAISGGRGHSLALKNDGTVRVWGFPSNRSLTEMPDAAKSGVTAVAAGWHSLVLKTDGSVVGWGGPTEADGTQYQCDQAEVPDELKHSAATAERRVEAIDAGSFHSLALRADGTVVGWGATGPTCGYKYGQADIPSDLAQPAADPLLRVKAISAGTQHSLALRANGSVVAWGSPMYSVTTIPPAAASGITAISTRDVHNLALKDDGVVVAWGWNGEGETNVPDEFKTPAADPSRKAVAVAAGSRHSMVLRADGTVSAWGLNTSGQIDVPSGLAGASAISAGWWHSMALVPDRMPPSVDKPDDVTKEATTSDGATVTYPAPTVTDNTNPAPAATCSPASDSLFPIGRTTVTCTAVDASHNESTATFTVTVTYPWSEILQPINADGSSIFKIGRTVPVKFSLTGAFAAKTDLVATLSYTKVSDNVEGTIVEAESTAAASTGNRFRFADGQYLFNWSTTGLTVGTYHLKIDLGDGNVRTVPLSLR